MAPSFSPMKEADEADQMTPETFVVSDAVSSEGISPSLQQSAMKEQTTNILTI
jgi:hypothetical protein